MPDRAANPSGSVQLEDMIGEEQEKQCLTNTHTASINNIPKSSTSSNSVGSSATCSLKRNGLVAGHVKNSPMKGSHMSLNHNYDDVEDLNKKNTPSRHSVTLSRHSLAKTDEELEVLDQ